MPQNAQVTSVEAIAAFRSSLIVYTSKARATVDEVSSDMLRVKLWLENDQRRLWENEQRKRGRKLEEARNELFSAKLSNLQEASSIQFLAVQRAERAMREVETKMALLKKWDRELQNHSEPMLKQVEQLNTFLTNEIPRAIAYLDRVVKTLHAYADVALPGSATNPAPAADPADEGGTAA